MVGMTQYPLVNSLFQLTILTGFGWFCDKNLQLTKMQFQIKFIHEIKSSKRKERESLQWFKDESSANTDNYMISKKCYRQTQFHTQKKTNEKKNGGFKGVWKLEAKKFDGSCRMWCNFAYNALEFYYRVFNTNKTFLIATLGNKLFSSYRPMTVKAKFEIGLLRHGTTLFEQFFWTDFCIKFSKNEWSFRSRSRTRFWFQQAIQQRQRTWTWRGNGRNVSRPRRSGRSTSG